MNIGLITDAGKHKGTDMIIRFANPEDLEKIADLYVYNHKTTYKGLLSDQYLDRLTTSFALDKWYKQLHSEKTEIWAAYEGESFLGFASGMPDPELELTWYLDSLHVEKNSRGKGVGTALIHAVAQHAAELGFRKMSVCIVCGNDVAGNLYQKLGARHYSFFEDDFCGTASSSEKLIWNELPTDPDRPIC